MMDRRTWFQLLAVLAAAPETGGAQQPAVEAPQRVTRDMLIAALKSIGLEFSDAHIDLMLPSVNRGLSGIDNLRKIPVPLDTSPAFTFFPLLPGRKAGRPGKFQPAKYKPRRDWKNIEDLAFWPVTDLGPLLKAKRITSTALTKMYLERLKQYSPSLLCVITLTSDLALEQAARADSEIRRGRYKGPLHGIPWGAKDLLATKGIPTTWGAEPFQNQVFDYNATVVDRLEKAGAVLVAKLSMGALAMGGLWFAGMTKTPWLLTSTSSGSSAGSASATAAGLVGFSIGTETLGSIISPAVRCGAVGLRPTYGRVSRHGAMALSWTMDKIGPICRSVEDTALVLQAIYGPDGKDNTVLDAPFIWDPARRLSSLKIGIVQKDFDSLAGEEKTLLNQAVEDLKKAGVKLTPVSVPDFDVGPLRIILSAEAATAFDDITRDGQVDKLRDQGAGAWPNSFRTSRMIPAVEYIRASRARTLLMQTMDKFFADWDVIVSPPHAGNLLTTTNLTGHPQVVVPCGIVNKLPRGIAFTGRPCEEGSPLRVALAFEKATKWHEQRPPLSLT